MWGYKLFRIGALILALNGTAHLLAFLGSKGAKPVNSMEYHLHEVMYGYKFNVMGSMLSQGEVFDGLSICFSVFMLTLAALGFTLPVHRKPAIVIAASLAVTLGLSLTYWFFMPSMFLAAGLACFAGSAYIEKK